jgi:UrcA family protein
MVRSFFLAAVALLTASVAQAEPRRTFAMTHIAVGDLDLQSDAGAERLLRRLNAAAGQLCATERTPLLPAAEGRAWQCRREAMSAAVERLNTPTVSRAYALLFSALPPATP